MLSTGDGAHDPGTCPDRNGTSHLLVHGMTTNKLSHTGQGFSPDTHFGEGFSMERLTPAEFLSGRRTHRQETIGFLFNPSSFPLLQSPERRRKVASEAERDEFFQGNANVAPPACLRQPSAKASPRTSGHSRKERGPGTDPGSDIRKGRLPPFIIRAKYSPPVPLSPPSITCVSRAARGLTFPLFSFSSGLRCGVLFFFVQLIRR